MLVRRFKMQMFPPVADPGRAKKVIGPKLGQPTDKLWFLNNKNNLGYLGSDRD
tara:strand:- start:397 stop:555 length:159 start_codon:yes stop_codon:yes gene_type:complete